MKSKNLWRSIHYFIERTLTEEKLRLNEQRSKEVEAIGRIGRWEYDCETRKIEWSDEVYKLYERDISLGPPSEEEEALYYPHEEARRLRELASLSVERGEEFRYDLVAQLPSGRIVYFNASIHPVKNEKGRTVKLFGMVHDITERKQTEEALRSSLQEKEALLREVHHRVKNNMQIISSLLNLQGNQLQDPTILEIFKECQNRIRAMALVHEKLYRSKDLSSINFSEYIQDVVIHLFSSYKVDPNRVHFIPEMDSIYLDISTANSCALLVNELVSNALRHAFPGRRKGDIHIHLSFLEGHKLKLIVGDTGIGFPRNLDFRKTETLGMQIVMMLVSQLEGTIELNQKGGTEFKIIFNELKNPIFFKFSG